jgi:hypothetical protein
MKSCLPLFLSLASFALGIPPEPGTSSENVTYSLGGSSLNNQNQFTELTNSQLSDLEGKVILIAYYTPW